MYGFRSANALSGTTRCSCVLNLLSSTSCVSSVPAGKSSIGTGIFVVCGAVGATGAAFTSSTASSSSLSDLLIHLMTSFTSQFAGFMLGPVTSLRRMKLSCTPAVSAIRINRASSVSAASVTTWIVRLPLGLPDSGTVSRSTAITSMSGISTLPWTFPACEVSVPSRSTRLVGLTNCVNLSIGSLIPTML